mgnify:FL=1
MNPELIERTQRFLFATEEEMIEAKLPQPVQSRILRLRDMYAFWLRHPAYADKAIVAQLRQQHNISFSQAYEDVRLLKICLGNIGQMTRQWCQYLFMQRCEEGFEMARSSGDANAFAKMLAALGKFTRLDHDEDIGPDYSQIVPQQFELTSDPSVAGFERIPNVLERSRFLFARYKKQSEDAEYAHVIEESTNETEEHVTLYPQG